MLLISRRSLRSNNSWMHNIPKLVSGRPRCTLPINPADAAARGVVDGDVVRVRSTTGTVLVPAGPTSTAVTNGIPVVVERDQADAVMAGREAMR